jgi:hypothetical protein
LRVVGQIAQERTAAGHGFEVEHLRSHAGERGDQPALAGSCQSAHDVVAKRPGRRYEARNTCRRYGAIAAIELCGAPADFVQHMDERTAALAAAPAIDEGAQSRGFAAKDVSSIAAMLRATMAAPARLRGERRVLCVQGADANALGVAQHRMARRARQVVFGKLGRTAHVDTLSVITDRVDGHLVVVAARGSVDHRRDSRSGSNAGQTLSRSSGCAAAVGWTRSDWNMSLVRRSPRRRRTRAAPARRSRTAHRTRGHTQSRNWAALIPTMTGFAPPLYRGDHGGEIVARGRDCRRASRRFRRARPPRSRACGSEQRRQRALPPAVVSPVMLALTTR